MIYRVEAHGLPNSLSSCRATVYLAGENLEAQVRVKGHDGKPLARKLVMELSRLETAEGARHRVADLSGRDHE